MGKGYTEKTLHGLYITGHECNTSYTIKYKCKSMRWNKGNDPEKMGWMKKI